MILKKAWLILMDPRNLTSVRHVVKHFISSGVRIAHVLVSRMLLRKLD